GLKDNKEINLTLTKPVGIRHMSDVVVNVKISVGNETTKEFNNIDVEYENLGSNYTVNAKGAEDQKITVIVKGIKEVLDTLDPASIRAYVDLKEYGVGEHQVDVIVERTDL